jgi:hypothetical protein
VADDVAGAVAEGSVEGVGNDVECVVVVAEAAAVADEVVEDIEHAEVDVEHIEDAAAHAESADVGAEDVHTDHNCLASAVGVEVVLPIHPEGTVHKTTEGDQ